MTPGIRNVTLRLNDGAVVTNTVAAGMAKGLLDFAVARGADGQVLLQMAGVDAASLENEDARLPFVRYVAMYAAAEVLSADPAFALHLGEAMTAMDSMLVCHVGSACDTMADALAAINRYGPLAVDVETAEGGDPFQIERSDAGWWLIDASRYPGHAFQLTDTSFARLIAGTRMLTDRAFVRAVHLVRPAPAHGREYERLFRAPVRFEQARNALLLDPEWFALPLNASSSYARTVFEAHADALLERLEPPAPHRRAVEDAVRDQFDAGIVSIERVARQLGVSRQTLHRQLRGERTTFEAILDRVRCETATALLREGTPISDIAHRLGFSDRSAFSRAFKRWTGRSPRNVGAAANGR